MRSVVIIRGQPPNIPLSGPSEKNQKVKLLLWMSRKITIGTHRLDPKIIV